MSLWTDPLFRKRRIFPCGSVDLKISGLLMCRLLLLQENCTVTVCHSKTKNLAEITKNADILVAAIGRAKFVKADMIKPGAAVIDVGINRLEDGTLAGDVDFDEAEKVAQRN